MTDDERKTIAHLRERLADVAHGGTSAQRLGLIARMLLVYPMTGDSQAAGKARGEAYLEAIGDVAPWALNQAITRWHRGEAGLDERGDPYNYTFAPAPAVLRRICLAMLKSYTDAETKLRQLAEAVTLERAMDTAPLETEPAAKALALREAAD